MPHLIQQPSSKLVTTAAMCVLSVFASSADAQMKYSIKPKQVVPYEVKIVADTPSSIDTLTGVIAYTGQKVEGNNLTLGYTGGLRKISKAKASSSGGPRSRFGGGRPGGRPGGGPPRPRSPFEQPDFRGLTQTTNTILMSNTGEVESMTGDSQLPYLLGNLSTLPFDILPGTEKKAWEDGNGLTITSGKSSSNSRFGGRFGPRGPFSDNNEEKTKKGGGESTKFRVSKDNGNLVTIAKDYSLSSPAATSDETGFNIKGSGTWVFNRKDGVSESMNYKATLNVQANNSTFRIPLTIAFKRMTEKDYLAYKKKVQDDRAAMIAKAKAAAGNRAKPTKISSRNKTRIMGRLKNSKSHLVWAELESLNRSRMSGLVKSDMDLLTVVGKLRASSSDRVRKSAEKVWKKWGASFNELASSKQKAEVAAAVGEEKMAATTNESDDDNPFKVDGDDDGKGMRIWKSGRFEIEAEFQKVDGRVVILKNKAGKTVRVPMTRLSADDKKLVEKLSGK